MKHLKLMNIVNSKSDRSNTGYRGISLRQRKGRKDKYQVMLHHRSKNGVYTSIHIANTDTLEEAIEARKNFILNLL